jgi:hypothetical protein
MCDIWNFELVVPSEVKTEVFTAHIKEITMAALSGRSHPRVPFWRW